MTVSPRSLQLLRTRRPHYLQSPASLRLYAHASVRAQQSTQRLQQHEAEVQEKEAAELAACTFKPDLLRTTSGASPHSPHPPRVGRAQFELIEDWDGSKRQRRMQRLQEEAQQLKEAELPFRPEVNAVSRELAADPLRRKRRPLHHRSPSTPVPPSQAADTDPQEKRERIRRFLQRTAERQREGVQRAVVEEALPSFTPTITVKARELGRVGGERRQGLVGAGERKRRRKCEEIFHAYQSSGGYIARVRWVSLVKALGRAVAGGTGGGKEGGRGGNVTLDDVAAIGLVIKECDREVRRVRKEALEEGGMADGVGGGGGLLEEGEDLTWRLSLEDFVLWFERMWGVVVHRARSAESSEQRVMQHFKAPADQ